MLENLVATHSPTPPPPFIHRLGLQLAQCCACVTDLPISQGGEARSRDKAQETNRQTQKPTRPAHSTVSVRGGNAPASGLFSKSFSFLLQSYVETLDGSMKSVHSEGFPLSEPAYKGIFPFGTWGFLFFAPSLFPTLSSYLAFARVSYSTACVRLAGSLT